MRMPQYWVAFLFWPSETGWDIVSLMISPGRSCIFLLSAWFSIPDTAIAAVSQAADSSYSGAGSLLVVLALILGMLWQKKDFKRVQAKLEVLATRILSDVRPVSKDSQGEVSNLVAPSQVEGTFNGEFVRLGQRPGMKLSPPRFIVKKKSKVNFPFRLKEHHFFKNPDSDDSLDIGNKFNLQISDKFLLFVDEAEDLQRLSSVQIATFKRLCVLRNFEKVINSPSIDGFQIYFKGLLLEGETDKLGIINTVRECLYIF